MAKFAAAVCLVLMCMVVVAPHAKGAGSCDKIAAALSPCISYVIGSGPLLGQCCNGIRAINGAARTPADRRAACGCLKSLAGRFKNIKPGLVSGLPGRCGVRVPYPISATTDCSRVK